MRRYLVVANQTLQGDELVEVIRQRAAAEPSEFHLVVPATPVLQMVTDLPAMPLMGAVPAVPSSPEEARRLAQARLDEALSGLKNAGVPATGAVQHADPMRAVEDALKEGQFDEIIVSTLPRRVSRWLHQDLPRRLEHRFQLPVTHVGGTVGAHR
jgi:nucleotide-binding universal stress UspA family protein